MTEELSLAFPQTDSTAEEVDLPALVAAYSNLLFRVAHSLLRNPSEAEDVVQDVFVRVLQHRRKLASLNDTRVWLVRIAWNLALDRRRRTSPDQIDDAFAARLISPAAPADLALHNSEEVRAVLSAIDRLPPTERQALLLCALEELSTTEVAGIMGKSESSVRALVFRARERLRTRLNRKGASQ